MRGAYATAGGFAIRLGARLVFLFVAGRLFGARSLGEYLVAVAVIELMVAIGNLGTKKLIFPLLDTRGERAAAHVVADAALLVAGVSLALGAALAAAVLLLPGQGVVLALLAPGVAGQALLDLLLAVTRWRGAVRFEVVARSVVEPYAAVAASIAAWALGAGPFGLAIGYGAGTLAALGYAGWGARAAVGGEAAGRYRPSPATMRRLLTLAGPNIATDALAALYARLDLYLVGVWLGSHAAGVYGMARQVSAPIRQIRQSFDGLLIPLVARTVAVRGSATAGAALASATRLVLAIQLPVVLALAAIGAPLLGSFGPGFAAAYWALVVLAAAETVQAAFGTGDLLFVYLNPRTGLVQTATGAAVGAVTAMLLLPELGITGGAVAVLAGYLVRAAMRSWALRRRFGVTVPLAHPAGPLLAAATGAAAIVAVANPWAALAAGLIAYAAVLAAWLRLRGASLRLTGFEAPPPG